MKRQKSIILIAILIVLSPVLICGLAGLGLYFVNPDFPYILFPTPEYRFRVFVADPIPEGVSNIQTFDMSMGFDQEIDLAFNVTPEAIDEIIAFNQLELIEKPYFPDPPYDIFYGINWNKDWVVYGKKTQKSKVEWPTMWVNPERNTAIFQYIYG